MAVIRETYVHGVSTHAVDKLAKVMVAGRSSRRGEPEETISGRMSPS